MRLISVVLVLLITQLTGWVFCAESSEESPDEFLKDIKRCPGGYCVQAHLCRNGTMITDGVDIIDSRFGEMIDVDFDPSADSCEEFLLRCCAAPESMPRPPPSFASPVTEESMLMPPPSCGMNHPNGYIYRVKDSAMAQFAEFPWMALLLQRKALLDKESIEYLCGGSLIHPQVVLTAAHCVKNVAADDVLVRLGEWDIVRENEALAHQQHGVSRIITHENFTDVKFHNDLALLIMKTEADLNTHINPICLPSADDNFDGMRCMVSGWGKENFNPDGKFAEVLKKVELPVVQRKECKRMFWSTRLGPFFRLDSSFMCAGGELGVDACKGDGGSPLACKIGDSFVQAGIVAWGLGCGEDGVPGAYVKVSNFVDWIETTLTREKIEL